MYRARFLFLLIGTLFFSNPSGFAQNLEQDSLVLVQFYQSMNGANWTDNDQWLVGPVQSWSGIGLFNQRVDTIFFNDNNLAGTLPEEISQLQAVRILSLRGNPGITGAFPSAIGDLTELRSLILVDNGLEGPIPEQLGNLNNLINLTIEGNQLSGGIPQSFGDLVNLEILNLSEQRISGIIPENIYNLNQLRQFSISCDSITGEISDNVGNLTELTSFALSNTLISGTIPSSLSNAQNLRFLILINNRNLNGSFPPQLWGLNNVGFLVLFNNQLKGGISPEIGSAERLQQLIINDNRFEGDVPTEIITLDSLEIVALQNNFFTGLPDMSAMKSLNVLTVQNNHLTFEDIEPNLVLRDRGTVFFYAPQRPVYDTTIISARAGARLVVKGEIGGSANRYQWFRERETIVGGANADLIINDVSIQDAGNYSAEIASVIVPDLTINRNPISLQVTVNEPIRFCDPVTLEVSVADTIATYKWSTGDTTRSVIITEPGNYSVVIETANYTLEETFVTELGSSDLIPGTDIDFDIFIDDMALPEDQLLLVNGPVQFANTSLAGSGFQWDFGDGTSTIETSPFHKFTSPGSYNIRLSAFDDEGCEVVYERAVEVKELFVTNAITPNNDGNNDQLFVEPFLYPASLRVVNRWGQEVYYRSDYPNDFNGSDLSPGVYFYEINIESIGKKANGTITIID